MHIKKLLTPKTKLVLLFVELCIIASLTAYLFYLSSQTKEQYAKTTMLQQQLSTVKKELTDLQNQDQVLLNKKNAEEIKNIQTTYKDAVGMYERLADLRAQKQKTDAYDKQFAQILSLLSTQNYASAQATLKILTTTIDKDTQKNITTVVTAPINNAPPAGGGYQRQTVQTDNGSFVVDIIAGDLGNTKVIVDTASESDCSNNCPVLSLSDYVARNGAYAGVNGSYFCPTEYPSCAGKSNSFDTLLMNKNKTYFNSANNVYSTIPAVIFGGSWVRFVSKSLEWGRDTGVDSVLANQPLLVYNGQNMFGGNDDPKQSSSGTRGFVAAKGNTVYIGMVHTVSVTQMATVLQKMGMENAINLDSGGSAALWYGGYKVGPGRNIPNVILFVRK